MNHVIIDAGTLHFSDADLTASGLLVPYGVEARSNLGRFTVDTGVFSIPADLTGASLNVEHQREHVVGAFSKVWEQAGTGLFAAFKFADTAEGRAAYQDAKSGKRSHLSAEVAKVAIKNGKAIGGRLFAAALVEKPAFAGATLLAAEDLDYPTPVASSSEYVSEFTDDDGVTWQRVETYQSETTETTDGYTSTSTTTVTETPVDAADPEDPQPDPDNPDDKETTLTATAQPAVAGTLLAGAPAAQTTPRPPTRGQILTALARAGRRMASADDMTLLAGLNPRLQGDVSDLSSTLLAALNNINVAGGQSGTANGQTLGNIAQPNWLGIVNPAKSFKPKYYPLLTNGTDISLPGKVGFDVKRGTSGSEAALETSAAGGAYAGAGAAIGSNKFFTVTAQSALTQWAKGEAFERSWFDLSGGEQFVAAALALLEEEVDKWKDLSARDSIVAAAGAPITPLAAADIFPSGSDILANYPPSLIPVVQGLLALQQEGTDGRSDTPTFSIVNEIAMRQLVFYGFVNELNQFKFTSTTGATGSTDGIQLVQGKIGIEATPAALTGCDYGIQLDTLPGGTLHIDALELANGNIDRAIHAYLQTFVARAQAFRLVGTAPARANETAYAVGDIVKASTVIYRAVVAGTSHTSAPSAPAVGATVTDGTVTWLRLA